MNLRHKIALSCLSATILAFGCLVGAVAQTSPYIYEDGTEAASRGIIDVNGAKFDSTDLGKIYNEVNLGKSNVKDEIIAKGGAVTGTGENGLVLFTDFVTGVDTVYDAGANSVWESVRDNATASNTDSSNLSANYNAVTDLSELRTAILEENTAAYNEGYTSGLAQAASNASSNIPTGYNFNISISLPLNGNTSSTWIQNDEETTQTASAGTTIDISSGVFKTIKINPSFTTQSGGPHHSESTSVTVTAVKDGGTFTLSNKGNYTYDITGYTSVTVNLYASVYSDAWGTDQHNTVKASVSGTATLSS